VRAQPSKGDSAARLGTLTSVPTIHGRVTKLYEDLRAIPEGSSAGPPVLNIYNTLLKLAREQQPNDPVMSTMSAMSGQVEIGTLRILVGQVLKALSS